MRARYVSTQETPLRDLAEEVGRFDVVIEAAGDAQVMLDTLSLLARNGIACLLGLDASEREVAVDGRVLGVDAIAQNRALIASVNANRVDWLAAVENLDRARERWPEALEAFVGQRVTVDRFGEAFGYGWREGHAGLRGTSHMSTVLRPENAESPTLQGFQLCAEEDSNLHAVKPGPGPQPGNSGVIYVQIVRQRPDRPWIWTEWT